MTENLLSNQINAQQLSTCFSDLYADHIVHKSRLMVAVPVPDRHSRPTFALLHDVDSAQIQSHANFTITEYGFDESRIFQ